MRHLGIFNHTTIRNFFSTEPTVFSKFHDALAIRQQALICKDHKLGCS